MLFVDISVCLYFLFLLFRMFCRAMSISQEDSLLWHDLASTNFWHAMAIPLSNKRSDILQRAMTAARRAVNLNSRNSLHWNLLGVIAATEGKVERFKTGFVCRNFLFFYFF